MLTRTVFRSDPVVRSRRPNRGREIVVAGAQGGAGASTLAVLLHPAWDVGVICGPGQECPQVCTGGRPLVLVTRNTTACAARATVTVHALASQWVRVAVLAVVSDGLPEPGDAAYRFTLLSSRVGAVVRVPFVPLLRAVDDPTAADLPRRARRAVAAIRAEALGMAGWAFPGTREERECR